MAFRTPNALLPGYTAHLIPDHTVPCSSTSARWSFCWSPGYTCCAAAGDALSAGSEDAARFISFSLYSNVILQTLTTLPSFHHSLSPTLLTFSLQSTYHYLMHAHVCVNTHNLSLSPIKCKLHVGRDCLFFSPL